MFTGQRRLEKQVESLQSGDIRILCMHCVLIWRPGFYYDIHGAVASSTRDNEEVLSGLGFSQLEIKQLKDEKVI